MIVTSYFFNFNFDASDMTQSLESLHIYQALDNTKAIVLAEASSYNELAKSIGISNVSVRNNMNWYLGTEFTIDGETVHGYIREVGIDWRTTPVHGQLGPKSKYSILELSGRTLYDLIPGKLYVININTLTDYGIYNNERDLWVSLNPTKSTVISKLSLQEQHQYLNNRIGRYLNVMRPGGNPTEAGYFYFARNPDYLAGLAKPAQALFAITAGGLCTWYANFSSVTGVNRGTVRRNLVNNTVSKTGVRYILANVLIKQFPDAVSGIGGTYKLSPKQMKDFSKNFK